ncbi:hypothetical protein THRCLA_22254 [Thraustotheca clavata]|uniref:PX domain-containing protein n=1 Tax=Thraustotheca clavata TaxID=74557 RepID=A0A1V9Z836_9STRA|nr:hypothetical protein THRCLA_22254 [Thraustotheca clavata]
MTYEPPSSFLSSVDVMIASIDDSYEGGHHHTKYLVQVTERGTGHWVVPRRYSQFRILSSSIRTILAKSKTRLSKANDSHDQICQALRCFKFPKKTLSFGFFGTSPTSRELVYTRLGELHNYLQTLVQVLRMYNWENAQVNGITKQQATMMTRLVQAFLAIPDDLGINPSRYVHTNPMCSNSSTLYCAQHVVLQENASKRQQEYAVQALHRAKPYATMLDNYATVLESQMDSTWQPISTLRSSRAVSFPLHNTSSTGGSYHNGKQSMLRPSIVFLTGDFSTHDQWESTNDIPMLSASPESPRDTIFLG